MLKKTLIFILITSVQCVANAQQTYHLDLKKSKILWDARKTMGGHFGYIFFSSGSLNYSLSGEPQSGTFILNMNSMHSIDHTDAAENDNVDQKLKTEDFFNMAVYPTATMNIQKISRSGHSSTYLIDGALTIKGITHPIQFNATITENNHMIYASAKTKIDRKKWNIDYKPNPEAWNLLAAVQNTMIADEIGITLDLVLVK